MSANLRVLDPDDRTEWLGWRKGGLGASEIAAVAGLSPFESPTAVYLRKVGLLQDSEDQEWQRIARRLEPVIAQLYCEEREGWAVIDPQACVTDPERPWMRATLDGVAVPPDGADSCPFECKTTTRWNGDWGAEPPDYYQCQAQWQMAVTGADRAILAALIDVRRFRWWEILRHQGEIDLLISIGEAFWRRVLERRPPPVDGSERTREALQEAFEDRERAAIDLNGGDLELVETYREARDARLAAEKEERRAESRVIALLEGAEEARWQDKPALRWSRRQRTTDDMEAMRAACVAAGIEIRKKTTEYRQFWLPKRKEAK